MRQILARLSLDPGVSESFLSILSVQEQQPDTIGGPPASPAMFPQPAGPPPRLGCGPRVQAPESLPDPPQPIPMQAPPQSQMAVAQASLELSGYQDVSARGCSFWQAGQAGSSALPIPAWCMQQVQLVGQPLSDASSPLGPSSSVPELPPRPTEPLPLMSLPRSEDAKPTELPVFAPTADSLPPCLNLLHPEPRLDGREDGLKLFNQPSEAFAPSLQEWRPCMVQTGDSLPSLCDPSQPVYVSPSWDNLPSASRRRSQEEASRLGCMVPTQGTLGSIGEVDDEESSCSDSGLSMGFDGVEPRVSNAGQNVSGISQQMTNLCPDIMVKNTFLDVEVGDGSSQPLVPGQDQRRPTTIGVLPSFWPGADHDDDNG